MPPKGKALPLTADARQFKELLGKTSAFEPKLRTALRKRIRAEADKGAKEAREEVAKAPGTVAGRTRVNLGTRGFQSHKGLKARGVRQGIAAGIKVQVAANGSRKVGVFIRSTGAGLPPSQRFMVRAWDKEAGWRHPVFGTSEWVQQKGRPYFGSVIAKREQEIAEGVKRALDEAARTL